MRNHRYAISFLNQIEFYKYICIYKLFSNLILLNLINLSIKNHN